MRISVVCATLVAPSLALRHSGSGGPIGTMEDSWFDEPNWKPRYADYKPPVNPKRWNPCAALQTPPACESPQNLTFTASLVVSTFLEDLKWVNAVNWDGNVTVYVHNRTEKRSHNAKLKIRDSHEIAEASQQEILDLNRGRKYPVEFENIPNKGDEATAYLSYIITKYYKLPDVVFFVQADRCAPHMDFDMAVALPLVRSCFPFEKGYIDINNYHGRMFRESKNCKSTAYLQKHPITGLYIKDLAGIWNKLFVEDFGPLPDDICWDQYSQFAVKKELILRHPVSLYKKLFHGVLNGTTTMEFFWKMLFVPSALRMRDHSEEAFEAMKRAVLQQTIH